MVYKPQNAILICSKAGSFKNPCLKGFFLYFMKIKIFLKKLSIFTEFIIEELPSIFSILIIPTTLGYLLLIPTARILMAIVTSVIIEIYLFVKSEKKFPKSPNEKGWQIALVLTSLFFGLLVIFVISLTKINLEFGLKFQK